MGLTFYYSPMSSSSITEAILAELNIPCERVKLDIALGDTRAPSFLAINPNGCVPTIVHDGTPIWESVAITIYLGETFGTEKGLYPPPGPKRGEAMKWVVWSMVTFGGPVSRVVKLLHSVEKKSGPEDAEVGCGAPEHGAALEKAKEDLAVCLRVMEGSLEGRQFLLGEDYSVVDTHLMCIVGYLKMLGVDFGPFPNLAGWLKRRNEREAMVSLLKRDLKAETRPKQ